MTSGFSFQTTCGFTEDGPASRFVSRIDRWDSPVERNLEGEIVNNNQGEKMKRSVMFFIVALISIMAAGCATMNTVNEMPAEVDFKVKNMQPPSGKSLVYIVRPTLIGKPFGGTISANDEYIGTTQGGLYVYAVLAPGEYKIKVTGHDKDSDIVVNLETNKIYYIEQSVYPGLFKGMTSLALLENDDGRKALDECILGDKLGEHIAH